MRAIYILRAISNRDGPKRRHCSCVVVVCVCVLRNHEIAHARKKEYKNPIARLKSSQHTHTKTSAQPCKCFHSAWLLASNSTGRRQSIGRQLQLRRPTTTTDTRRRKSSGRSAFFPAISFSLSRSLARLLASLRQIGIGKNDTRYKE